ncbi:MAG TPA: hypothetical protein VJM12_20140 [Pyrinomonadaceae bacterium]|nr:hypothetical protein [Pyrinomonadaceae bacterium]
MTAEFLQLLPYLIIAFGAGLLGAFVALVWSPGVTARGAIQHFAAGVVIAAVASDLIPEVQKIGTAPGVLGGFAAGGAAMIGLKWLVLKFEKYEKQKHQLPLGIAAAAGIDTLVDGAIISAGFSSGQQLGGLLAIALSVELFFLTLSVGSEFHKSKSNRWKGLAITSLIALMLLVGALAAFFALQAVSDATLAIVLAFGAAALIYLVAEELLVESIQAEENLFSTTMLFAGFLVVLAIKLLSR